MRRAPAFTAGIDPSLLSQQQKKKMKKDPTGKKRKQTNSSEEPDSKAAKTDGSDNSDSDNGESKVGTQPASLRLLGGVNLFRGGLGGVAAYTDHAVPFRGGNRRRIGRKRGERGFQRCK